ncbi:MAG: hypothetical protein ACLGH3_00300 [Actinomycetota bacterium]
MSDPRSIDERDDRPHEHGGEDGWRESLTYVAADPAVMVVVRATWDPQARTAAGDLLIRLEDGVILRAAFREDRVQTRETSIGALTFGPTERLNSWQLSAETVALVTTPGTVLVGASATGTEASPAMGQAKRCSVELSFEATGEAEGMATRRRVITDQRFASIVSSGHFDQPVRAAGEIRIGDRRLKADMHGLRTRTWGVREPDPNDARLLVGFEEGHAVWHERLVLSDATIQTTGCSKEGNFPDRLQVSGEGTPERLLLGGLAAEVLAVLPPEADEPTTRLVVRATLGDKEALGYAELAVSDSG